MLIGGCQTNEKPGRAPFLLSITPSLRHAPSSRGGISIGLVTPSMSRRVYFLLAVLQKTSGTVMLRKLQNSYRKMDYHKRMSWLSSVRARDLWRSRLGVTISQYAP